MKILMVVAPEDFRDEEFFEPKSILEKAGLEITVASKGVNQAISKFGKTTPTDKDISEVSPADYNAVIFIGGGGSSIYFNDPIALSLAKKAFENDKIIGAICIAPSILANAGILRGKKATAFSSEASNLQAKGAIFTGENVTVDGKIITASGPQAASEFGQKILQAIQ